jgi:hypothetical protein
MTYAEHNKIHNLGRKMDLSDAERARRHAHGKAMVGGMLAVPTYTKRSRQEAGKELWAKRTPEQRAEIGRKISEAKKRKAV